MLTAYKIILFIVLFIALMGVIGEKDNENIRMSMTGIAIADILALTVLFIWL